MKVGTDFSGIGAPEMALKYLGINFESVFACEIDKYARKSFEQLHEPKKFYKDIATRNHKEVEQLDLYVAGFPCQSFSMAGKRKGFDEARGTLFFNVAEFIKENKPKIFILENVKGLLSHDNGKTFQTIVDILSNGGGTKNGQISLDVFEDGLGYHIYWQVLNTKNYGIPQNRERIFIVGFKDFRDFSFPKTMELKLRLGDMLQDNPNSKYYLSDKMIKGILKSNFRERKPIDITKISKCLKVGGDIPCFEVVSHSLHPRTGDPKKGGTGHLSKNDGTSYCLDTSNSQAIELDKKIRRLTPLECWRLQGFKDEDFFKVKDISDTQLYKQAGNSITVNVLMEIFKKIYAINNK
jgi:DNA (cytosine-5)-methyltransferase 1